MTLSLTCPSCGCHGDAEAFLADGDGKRLAALFAELPPPLARAALAYLRLFKPAKQSLRLPRACRIVGDLVEMVQSGSVSRDERTHAHLPAPAPLWTAGIEQMLAAPPAGLPLQNHRYLRAVVYGLAEQTAARAEAQLEEQRRTGQHRRTTPAGQVEAETARDREIAWVRQVHSYGQIDDAERDRRLAEIKARYQEASCPASPT